MTVASVLKHKGNTVVAIQPGISLQEAARVLREKRIGAVVVLGAGRRVVGILSERDIITAIAEAGHSSLDCPVNDFMTAEVKTCRLEDSIQRVMEVMTNGRFRHMPVVENGELVGLVSIGDVVKRRLDEAALETDSLKRYIAAG